MLSKVFDFLKDIKVIIGILSTAMIVLSAFRYELIYDDPDDLYTEPQSINVTTIDKKVLDALSKFDRNVRHLLIKGKEASKYDFLKVLPDFKEALEQATKLLEKFHKLNLTTNYNCKDDRRKDYKQTKNKGYNNNNKKHGDGRTLAFSLRLGSHVHKISLYWPKLLRLFIGDVD